VCSGGVVRVQLRRAQRPPAVRARALQVHFGGRVRRVRHQEVSAHHSQQVLRHARQGLQILPGL